ncbi:MAG: ethanolamine ammonia-lyase reactivating factor EutA [Burkholderiales bacterium]
MANPTDKGSKRPHTLDDHLLGEDHGHTHDGEEGADHDHDHYDAGGPLEDNPLWIQDHVSLVSVGIDIGSSGTQVIFSRLNLRRLGEDLSSRYYVVSRETLFQSPVALTPYKSEQLIDDVELGAIVDGAFASAGLHPDDIDVGAVILTGEALRRENAQAIAGILADERGEFVCAAAGHHMESMLAAFGSGAARVSHDTGKRILNIDIGGGTTKLALVDRGKVTATAAVHVGGRLLVVDEQRRIVRLDPAGRRLAAHAGFHWNRGDVVDAAAMERVAEWMAEAILLSVSARPIPSEVSGLFLTEPLPDEGPIDGVMFSGGVAEYVYERETRDFGDLGRLLGFALRRRLDAGALAWPLFPPGECIRATALGASEYSVQLSGNTLYISNPGVLLPRKNLQVLQPSFRCEDSIDPQRLAAAIREHFKAFDLVEGDSDAALALRWEGAPSYERIAALGRGIRLGLANTIAKRRPLYIMVDGDIAQTLGAILRDELGIEGEILVIDGVVLWDFDYIDLGRIRMPSQTVPVTVKSLVFSEDPRALPERAHAHRRAPREV